MQSSASTVADYLAELPDERRRIVTALRQAILDNLDSGYTESMQGGMIGYSVPHSLFPAGYHCNPKQPLPFAAIASQKNYVSVYLLGVYCGCVGEAESSEVTWFREAWAASGKQKLDMGKACVRVRKIEDAALGVIGEAIRRVPAHTYIERYVRALATTAKGGGKKTP
ncbi:MAG: DUF1801 domain-containing protein [Pseudomonadota bacterium]|nr:DUF1801 domain-containing protein [Pseudomonadota bacterium]